MHPMSGGKYMGPSGSDFGPVPHGFQNAGFNVKSYPRESNWERSVAQSMPQDADFQIREYSRDGRPVSPMGKRSFSPVRRGFPSSITPWEDQPPNSRNPNNYRKEEEFAPRGPQKDYGDRYSYDPYFENRGSKPSRPYGGEDLSGPRPQYEDRSGPPPFRPDDRSGPFGSKNPRWEPSEEPRDNGYRNSGPWDGPNAFVRDGPRSFDRDGPPPFSSRDGPAFSSRERPEPFGPSHGPVAVLRDGPASFGSKDALSSRDGPPPFGPRDEPASFSRREGPSSFSRDESGPFGPRDGPPHFSPRDAPSSRDGPSFGPRDRPRPSFAPKDREEPLGPSHGSRGPSFGQRDGPTFKPRDGPPPFGPKDGPESVGSRDSTFSQRDGPQFSRDGRQFSRDGPQFRRDGPPFGQRDGPQPFGSMEPPPSFKMDRPPQFSRRDDSPPPYKLREEPPHFRPREEAPFGQRDGPSFAPRDGPKFEPREPFESRGPPPPFAPSEEPRQLMDRPSLFSPRNDPRPLGHREKSPFGPESRSYIPRDESPIGPKGVIRSYQPIPERPILNNPIFEPRISLEPQHYIPSEKSKYYEPRSERADFEPRPEFRHDIEKSVPSKRHSSNDRHINYEDIESRHWDKYSSERRDIKEFRSRSPHFSPKDRHEKRFSPERRGPVKRQREEEEDRLYKRSRSSDPKRSLSPVEKSQERSEAGMELRDLVVGRISGQMLLKNKESLPENSQLYLDVESELRKIILYRIDSIFGIDFGHSFSQIMDGYRLHHKETRDMQLLDKLIYKCSAKDFVSRRATGISSSQAGLRELESKSHSKGHKDHYSKSSEKSGDDPVQNNEENKKSKLYFIKDDLSIISVEEGVQIKDFLVNEIIKATDENDFMPAFTLNGVQNLISLEVIAENEKSETWLLNHDFSNFKLCNILVYSLEELSYERASIWLPGHTNLPFKPLDKLRIQNKHLTGVNFDKWKLVKCVKSETGTRIFVDMDKESSIKLADYAMTLDYELEKVFVVLKCMSTDRGEFDKVFSEKSQAIDDFIVKMPEIPKLATKLTRNSIRMYLNNQMWTQENAKTIKLAIISRMFEDLVSRNIDLKFSDHGITHDGKFFSFIPKNEESCNWLLSLNLELEGKELQIEKGMYFPKFIKVGMFLPDEIGHFGPSVLENFNNANKIDGVDFTKWQMTAQFVNSEESGSKVAINVDLDSMVALQKNSFTLKYRSEDVKLKHNDHALVKSYIHYLQEGIEHYGNEDMDIDSEEENSNNQQKDETINTSLVHSASVEDVVRDQTEETFSVLLNKNNTNEDSNKNFNNANNNSNITIKTENEQSKNDNDNNSKKTNDGEDDDDVIICEKEEVVITIFDEEDDELSDIKNTLEAMHNNIVREIVNSSEKKDIVKQLRKNPKYFKCNTHYEKIYEGKFSSIQFRQLIDLYNKMRKTLKNLPARMIYDINNSVVDGERDFIATVKKLIKMS